MTQNQTGTPADRVFRNAKIYSVALDDTVTRAEAVAVAGGKIVYVGTNDGAAPFIGPKTEVTDCKGKTILPGFGDGHMHIGLAERRYGGVILYDLMSEIHEPEFYIKEIQKRLRDYVASHPDTKAVLGSGWDRAWFDGSINNNPIRPFTRHDLDAAVSDRPVILDSYCGHLCLYNSKALEEAGLLRTGVEQIPGGEIRMGADGIPDGFIQETAAINGVKALTPSSNWTKEARREAIASAFKDMAKEGITIATDYLHVKDAYDVLAQMAKDGEFTARVSGSFTLYNETADADLAYASEHRKEYEVGDLMKADAAKFFIDGNFALFDPYTKEACEALGVEEGFCGDLLWDEEIFRKTAVAALKAGFHLQVHAMGDRAVSVSAKAFADAAEIADKDKTKRNVIIHITLIDEETKRRMGKAGIIANVQPLWEGITVTGNEQELTFLGEKRFKNLYPCGSLMENGIVVAFGSDFTVNAFDTFGSLQTAITRLLSPHDVQYELCINDPVVNPAECISLQQAVKAGTINVAYELDLDKITGSIEVGKSAELVLIDRDIEATPADKLAEIKVVETVFKGKTVYKA